MPGAPRVRETRRLLMRNNSWICWLSLERRRLMSTMKIRRLERSSFQLESVTNWTRLKTESECSSILMRNTTTSQRSILTRAKARGSWSIETWLVTSHQKLCHLHHHLSQRQHPKIHHLLWIRCSNHHLTGWAGEARTTPAASRLFSWTGLKSKYFPSFTF